MISGKTNTVTTSIAVKGGTLQVAVNPVTANVYASGYTGSLGAVWEISGETNKITGRATVKDGAYMPGDPISPVTGDLYGIGGSATVGVVSIISG